METVETKVQKDARIARERRLLRGATPRKQSRYEEIEGTVHRLCTCCDKMLTLDRFTPHGTIHRSQCKECRRPKDKGWRDENIDVLRQKKREYRSTHLDEEREAGRRFREKNREYVASYMKTYKTENEERLRIYRQEYYQKNKERIIRYAQENRERIIAVSKIRHQERRKTDKGYSMKATIRSRVGNYIKFYGGRKDSPTFGLIGCTVDFLMEHLESLFGAGMTWDNYGAYRRGGPMKWQIDHIIPCAAFNLTDLEQQKECFHWTNCQPLWADENIRKGKRLDWKLPQDE